MKSKHIYCIYFVSTLHFLLESRCWELEVPVYCDNIFKDENPVACKKSFLWKVKRHPPVFFFGTIHVPYTKVWNYIPNNVKTAYELSQNVYFELDLTDPSTIATLVQCKLLPKGVKLNDEIPADLYRRLKNHFDYVKSKLRLWLMQDGKRGGLHAGYLINAIVGQWEKNRPVWIVVLLISLTEEDVKSRAIPILDVYLAQQAGKMNKKTGAIEEAEEHCQPLNDLDRSEVIFALNQTLGYEEKIREGILPPRRRNENLIRHYNCGHIDAMIYSEDVSEFPPVPMMNTDAAHVAQSRRLDEYFKDAMLFKRNRHMGNRVVELLTNHPDESFFFAFGIGHFLGNDTILDILREQNLRVQSVPPRRQIKHWKGRKRNSTSKRNYKLIRA